MDTLQTILVFACVGAFLFGYLGIGAWAIGDAQKRGYSGAFFVPLWYLFGPVSALIWLLVRPKQPLAVRAPETYNNADDALAAAAQLDQLGEWDAAVALYQHVEQHWPEHRDYVGACLSSIAQKQSLT